MSVPALAQNADTGSAARSTQVSTWRVVISEAVIQRCRAALNLNAEQKKHWPAVAQALRALAREPVISEAVVRRFAPAAAPLLASLDERQRQIAMKFAHRIGLAQYASLF